MPVTVRRVAIRASVFLCVIAAAGAGFVKLDDALGTFDLRADSNAAFTYLERTYPSPRWVAGSGKVIEDARLWMPEEATYRVVLGPRRAELGYSTWGPYFLNGFLLPREQTAAKTAPWVFCYGCDAATLGKLEILSDEGDGFVFGRRRS